MVPVRTERTFRPVDGVKPIEISRDSIPKVLILFGYSRI
jgi:hypothetical protein